MGWGAWSTTVTATCRRARSRTATVPAWRSIDSTSVSMLGRLVGGQLMPPRLEVDVVTVGPDGRGGVGDPLGLRLRLGGGHHSRTRVWSAWRVNAHDGRSGGAPSVSTTSAGKPSSTDLAGKLARCLTHAPARISEPAPTRL